MLKPAVITAEMGFISKVVLNDLGTAICEPILEVPLVHSPEAINAFSVKAVRQQMVARDEQDILLDEPRLDPEAEDDCDEGSNLNELEDEGLKAYECDMVYVLSAKYALPEPIASCPAVDAEGDDASQLIPKDEDATS